MGKVLTFYLHEELFGIDIKLVREIDRNVDYTVVPQSKSYIVGLINLRGQIVTLINLEKLMGREYPVDQKNVTCIILKNKSDETNQMGFIIERSGDVVDISEEDYEEVPANMSDLDVEYIYSVAKLNDELLMFLDIQKILNI